MRDRPVKEFTKLAVARELLVTHPARRVQRRQLSLPPLVVIGARHHDLLERDAYVDIVFERSFNMRHQLRVDEHFAP